MFHFMNVLRGFVETQERGATAVEYAMIIALIALALLGSLTIFGEWLRDALVDLADSIQSI